MAAATANVTISAPARDTTGPTVEVIGHPGADTFDVLVTDKSGLLTNGNAAADYLFENVTVNGIEVPTSAEGTSPVAAVALAVPGGGDNVDRFERPCPATWTCVRLRFTVTNIPTGKTSADGVPEVRTGDDDKFKDGDRIRVTRNTFKDKGGYGHNHVYAYGNDTANGVDDPVSGFKITGVSIGTPTAVRDALATAARLGVSQRE